MRTTTTLITTVITAATLVAVSACSNGSDSWSTAITHQPSDTADRDGQRADKITQTLNDLRKIDPCALLDREVIKTLTRVNVGIHLPGRQLSECWVDTDLDEYQSGWSFGVDVGRLYRPSNHSKKETINDEEYMVDSAESTCAYTRIVSTNVGVTLSTITPPSDESGDPCEMAKTYLAEAGTTFTDMGERDQQLTRPQIPLASHDPCEAAPQVAQALNAKAISRPIRPYLCSVQPDPAAGDSPLADQELSIAYEFKTDPRDDLPKDPDADPSGGTGLGTTTAVTIAGHPGSQFKGTGDLGCSVDIVVDDQVVLEHDSVRRVQVMSTLAHDCDVSKRAAEAVVTKLGGK